MDLAGQFRQLGGRPSPLTLAGRLAHGLLDYIAYRVEARWLPRNTVIKSLHPSPMAVAAAISRT